MPLARKSTQTTIAVLNAIYQRRATRAFNARAVSEDYVEALLDAAVQAPSAMNRQPWAFLVIQDREALRRISDAAKARFVASPAWGRDLEHKIVPLDDPKFDIFYGATTLIVICVKDEPGFCPEGDCYLAGQNLLLAAQAMGLATCPIGFARDVLQTEELRERLKIPAGYRAVLPIAVGYASRATEPAPREPARVLGWVR